MTHLKQFQRVYAADKEREKRREERERERKEDERDGERKREGDEMMYTQQAVGLLTINAFIDGAESGPSH